MEIMIKGTTKLKEMSAFHFGDEGLAEITIAQLHSYNEYDRVTANIKVLTSTDPIEASTGKKKQGVEVADISGVGIVTLWEANIGKLCNNQSYKLKSFLV